MSASSSLSAATAFMISSPSSWEAASTRSAIWAACSRPRRRWVRRRRELGTWPTNGSRCVHSTSSACSPWCPRKRRGSSRRSLAPKAGVDSGHAPDAVVAAQLDLPGDDQPGRVDVDQAVAEHVRPQQHLSRASLELGEVELGRRGPRRRHLRAGRCGWRGRTVRGRRCGPSGRTRAAARLARPAARRRPGRAPASPPTNPAADSQPRRRDARPHRTWPDSKAISPSPAPVRHDGRSTKARVRRGLRSAPPPPRGSGRSWRRSRGRS